MLLKAMLNNPIRARREIERTFESMLSGQPFGLEHIDRLRRPFPAINLWEDEEALYVESELPGMTLDDINVEVFENELRIKGTRTTDQPENAKTLARERPVGQFERAIGLPIAIDVDHVEARLMDGVLTITLPKSARAKARRIEIKTA